MPPHANEYPRNLFLAEISASSMSPGTPEIVPITPNPSADTRSHAVLTPASSLLSTHLGEATGSIGGTIQVPEFVTKPSLDIDQEDLAYLAARGVFDLPPTVTLHKILQCYLDYVYPLLPILDIHNLFHAVYGHTSRISLPLLYGIMLAASAFVDENTLAQTGYQSLFEWRSSLRRKLRVS